MRRLTWWGTDVDHEAGRHYTLVLESTVQDGGYLAEGRLIDSGMGYESRFYSKFFEAGTREATEAGGLCEAARWAHFEVKDMIAEGIPLEGLLARLWHLGQANTDTARKNPANEAQEPIESFQGEKVEEWYSRSTEALDRALREAGEPEFSESNCWESGPVVIDGTLHRVKDRFVECDPSLNRRAWNVSEAEGVCPECFPEKEKCCPAEADPVIDPFFIPETGEQMELFG